MGTSVSLVGVSPCCKVAEDGDDRKGIAIAATGNDRLAIAALSRSHECFDMIKNQIVKITG